MPVAVTHASIAVDGQKIWIVGGFQGNHPGPVTADVYVYDIATDSWSSGPDLPVPRGSGGAARLGRNLHYYGGVTTDKETDVDDHFILDLDNPGAGWSTGPPMPVARNHFGSTDLMGRAYAVGGQFRHVANPEDVDLVHAYDPVTQTWSEIAPLPFPRSHTEPGTFSMDGQLVIAGGRANTLGHPSVPDITAYDPLSNTWASLPPMPLGLLAPVARPVGDQLIISSGGVGPVTPQVATFARPRSAVIGEALRINAGGAPFQSTSSNRAWCVDIGAIGGRSATNPNLVSIANTDDDELYFSERTSANTDPTRFAYRIAIPNGLYRVKLHIAETFWGAPGGGSIGTAQRVFDVMLEDELVIDDLDINAEVGPAAALIKTFDVAIADAAIDLAFVASVDRPKVSAIEILRLADDAFESYCVAAPNSTGSGATIDFSGNISVAEDTFALRAGGAPASVSGLFLQGSNRVQTPLGAGLRCVGGSVFRLQPIIKTDALGRASRTLELTTPSQAAARILPGSSWNFQLWYRDGQSANLTDGLGVTFTD